MRYLIIAEGGSTEDRDGEVFDNLQVLSMERGRTAQEAYERWLLGEYEARLGMETAGGWDVGNWAKIRAVPVPEESPWGEDVVDPPWLGDDLSAADLEALYTGYSV